MATSIFAASQSSARQHGAIAGINITREWIVMRVLLVIFMVTMPLRMDALRLSLPNTPAARRTGPAAGAGRWQHLAGRCARRAGGSAAGVAAQYAQAPKAVLALDGADDANYRAFTVALAAARNAGFGDIAIRR